MALDTHQAENLQRQVGHQYGDVYVYGNAMLGDGSMAITQGPYDAEEQKRTILIDALDYTDSGAKRNQLNLTEIGPTSFDWVKQTQLPQWLQHGTTPFWISGKPGSGKSTLMRYLVDSFSTQKLLDSDGHHWTILHFFYDYRAGAGTANNPLGMLRHFLLQLVRSIPSAVKHVDQRQVQQQLAQGSIDDFIELIAYAVRLTRAHVCAFIDGLDEYDGHLWELCSYLDILRDRTGMKMCLASRPEPDLVSAFRTFPTIAIQDYNDASIKDYIRRKLLRCSSTYPNVHSVFTARISDSLRNKAQGVTLWAKLVVDEMLETYNHATTEQGLRDLLNAFPQELEQLYDRLIGKLPHAFRGDAILVLNLVANWDTRFLLDANILFQTVSFIFGTVSHQLFFGEQADCGLVELHIRSTLGRLLDFVYSGSVAFRTCEVRLIHETLATHLRRSMWHRGTLPDCAAQYGGPGAWHVLAVNVSQRVADDGVFDVSEWSWDLQEALQDRYASYMKGDTLKSGTWPKYSRGLDSWRDGSMLEKWIRKPEWKRLCLLLFACYRSLVVLPMEVPGLVHDRLDVFRHALSSDAMILHFMICEQCYLWIDQTGPWIAKIRRAWKHGRLDLVCAASHFALPYLSHALNPADPEPNFCGAVLNLISLTDEFEHRLRMAETLDFVERWVGQGGFAVGVWICATTTTIDWRWRFSDYCVGPATVSSNKAFSGTHDEDCKYYGTTNSLMIHWYEATFPRSRPWAAAGDMLELIAKAGVNIDDPCNGKGSAMEVLLSTFSPSRDIRENAESYAIYARDFLARLIALLDQGAGTLSSEKRDRALDRAVNLRRKLSVYNHTLGIFQGKVKPRILDALDATIQVLKHLKKNATVSEEDMRLLVTLCLP